MNSRPRLKGPPAKKELGQHFLQDEEIAGRIVQSLDLSWEDRALEIGPGRGVLLRFLLKASHKVTAVELDFRLRRMLEKTFGGHPGLDLVFADFTRFDLKGYLQAEPSPVKIIGNIPYSLSSVILFRLIEIAEEQIESGDHRLKTAVLMLQKEVAERVCAEPGGRDYGIVTVMRALVADAQLLFTVPPSSFIPPPKVNSAVVKLDFYPATRYRLSDRVLFSDLVHHVFARRRKMLKNTLRSLCWIGPDWTTIDFELTRRPEELSAGEFVELFDKIRLDSGRGLKSLPE
jgi:16S rRNA (adenine1518-N6/adenine1519-N6)-dimethyltransferase